MPSIPDEVFQIQRAIGSEVRIAGGAVRDFMMGVEPKDWDMCTQATPDVVIAAAEAAGLRHIAPGLEHGTVTFIINNVSFEVTTLRIDTDCDGRHAVVEFTDDWEADARRRDLTINAMMMGLNGNIHDYVGGLDDIKNKVIRFVGDPEERIVEDYLRSLRFFRFASRYPNFSCDVPSMLAISKHADGIASISAERVWSEMKQICGSPRYNEILDAMSSSGILDVIGFPFDSNFRDVGLDAVTVIGRMAADPKTMNDLSSLLKLSTSERRHAIFIASNHASEVTDDSVIDMLVDGADPTHVSQLIMLSGTGASMPSVVPVFPVYGSDLLASGMMPGPEMGTVLSSLKSVWKQSRYVKTRDELLSGHIDA